MPGAPRWRGIAGYSLAGLFAVYALYRTDVFARAASVSGSLWFPGFREYVFSHTPLCRPDCVYFSLGLHRALLKFQILHARVAASGQKGFGDAELLAYQGKTPGKLFLAGKLFLHFLTALLGLRHEHIEFGFPLPFVHGIGFLLHSGESAALFQLIFGKGIARAPFQP